MKGKSTMARFLFAMALVFAVLSPPAHAQGYTRIPTCGTATPPAGNSPGYMDAAGNVCGSVATVGANFHGSGSLSVTTSSVLANTMTVSASGAALPANFTTLTVVNNGTTDAAICPNPASAGAACTCPGNGVAATNGLTLKAGGGGWVSTYAILPAANPTVVACSGTPTLTFQW
jgi:hypothetical protein